MYEIIYINERKFIEKKPFISPQFPPNNLKMIKELFSLTDKELANKLSINPGFVSAVSNNRAAFSGIITLKLLKELGISFSTVYDVQSTVTVNCEDFNLVVLIVSIKNNINTTSEIYSLIKNIIKEYNSKTNDNSDTSLHKVLYTKLDIINDKLSLDIKSLPRLIDSTRREFYTSSIEEANNSDITIDGSNDYYCITFVKKDYKPCTLEINTGKKLDVEIDNILFDLPFKKYINNNIPHTNYELDLNRAKLNKNYTILRDNKLVHTNVLHNNEFAQLADKQSIIFRTFTTEDTLNKFQLYRHIKGYDMFYMANVLNLTVESYRLLEIGHNQLTTRQMWKIENVLGIQLENMINIDAYISKFSK